MAGLGRSNNKGTAMTIAFLTDTPIADTSVTVTTSPLALDEELDAAAHCADVLERVGLRLAFHADPERGVRIAVERPAGEQLRELRPRELFALIALSPAELDAWAARPELPIPARAEQAAAA